MAEHTRYTQQQFRNVAHEWGEYGDKTTGAMLRQAADDLDARERLLTDAEPGKLEYLKPLTMTHDDWRTIFPERPRNDFDWHDALQKACNEAGAQSDRANAAERELRVLKHERQIMLSASDTMTAIIWATMDPETRFAEHVATRAELAKVKAERDNLEQRCDPAGDLRARVVAEDNTKALESEVDELSATLDRVEALRPRIEKWMNTPCQEIGGDIMTISDLLRDLLAALDGGWWVSLHN